MEKLNIVINIVIALSLVVIAFAAIYYMNQKSWSFPDNDRWHGSYSTFEECSRDSALYHKVYSGPYGRAGTCIYTRNN